MKQFPYQVDESIVKYLKAVAGNIRMNDLYGENQKREGAEDYYD